MASTTTNAARARRQATSQRGQARRDQILEAATGLLLEQGHAGFSARGVADRAGLRLSHVQYYFPTPADIIGALLDLFIERYAHDALMRFREAPGDAPERLTATLRFLLDDDAYRDQCGVFMTEVRAIAQRDATAAAALTRYYEVYRAALDTIARELAPRLDARDRERRVAQCIALIEGATTTRDHLGSPAAGALAARPLASAVQALLTAADAQA